MQAGASNPRAIAWSASNGSGDWATQTDGISVRVRHTNVNNWEIYMTVREGGVQTNYLYAYANDSATWVFPRATKSGNNVTAWFYTDRARTNLITIKTHIFGASDRYRYSFCMQSDNVGVGGRALSFDVYRLIYDVNNVSAINPTRFFGAGFNTSSPYVQLFWTHSNIWNDEFEIQHSTDGINYTHLAYTNDLNYTHTGLANGSNNWYRVRTTYKQNGNWFNSSWENNFEKVHFLLIGAGAVNAVIDYGYYQVNSINNITGVLSGNQSELRFPYDGLIMNLTEVVGAPAFEIRFNWTGLPDNLTAINILMRAFYTGNLAHTVEIQIWNFTGNNWEFLELIPSNAGFNWYNNSVSALRGSFLNNGSVWVRVIHISAGNINHLMEFDYLSLRGIIPRIGNGNGDGVLSGWDINWITTFIWLALLGFGLFNDAGIVKIFAGLFGIILGLLFLAVNSMVAIALIFINFYFIYSGAMK
jgi:hypothetical protein